jgi:hypothetical protein
VCGKPHSGECGYGEGGKPFSTLPNPRRRDNFRKPHRQPDRYQRYSR